MKFFPNCRQLNGACVARETDIPVCRYVDCVQDPRHHNIHHILGDMLMIALCAVIAGADGWTQVAEYGRSKKEWFEEFLELPNGIPAHDTFDRLFARLDPEQMREFFRRWLDDLLDSLVGKTVGIDGKTLCGSGDPKNGSRPIHMVSAWVADFEIVLGQIKTEAKSNEIKAIPELVKTLSLKGAVVTIDAMGCQKKIADEIVKAEADYVIQVKENQPNLFGDIQLFFQDPENGPFDFHETVDAEHGRIETRKYYSSSDIDWLPGKESWSGLESLAMVVRERETEKGTSVEKSYYISSLEADASLAAKHIRSRWGIENGLHWRLDVGFREDHCRVRKGNGPENFAILRHIALNLLKKEKSLKGGIQTKRLKAAWDDTYLLKILGV